MGHQSVEAPANPKTIFMIETGRLTYRPPGQSSLVTRVSCRYLPRQKNPMQVENELETYQIGSGWAGFYEDSRIMKQVEERSTVAFDYGHYNKNAALRESTSGPAPHRAFCIIVLKSRRFGSEQKALPSITSRNLQCPRGCNASRLRCLPGPGLNCSSSSRAREGQLTRPPFRCCHSTWQALLVA